MVDRNKNKFPPERSLSVPSSSPSPPEPTAGSVSLTEAPSSWILEELSGFIGSENVKDNVIL